LSGNARTAAATSLGVHVAQARRLGGHLAARAHREQLRHLVVVEQAVARAAAQRLRRARRTLPISHQVWRPSPAGRSATSLTVSSPMRACR
jgi:hypothetical protein